MNAHTNAKPLSVSGYFMNTTCYLIHVADECKAVAFDPADVIAFKIIEKVISDKALPFELTVKVLQNGEWQDIPTDSAFTLPDLLPSSLAWLLMSESAKTFFGDNLTGKEGIEWIPVTVQIPNHKKAYQYFLVSFTSELDVLNVTKTTFVPGTDHIIQPHFDLKKITNYVLFSEPRSQNFWKIPDGLYVSDVTKSKIESSSLTGFVFEKAACS